ncbi:PITH domain-containing protein CG6153 isoform X2 [Ostrinia furnacalis]|uniref:PITH domain-containing protein CG6153 isoform X2 n=1 Tax=Ostrinia furnacalis TaxID=93504 RepID=UPI001039EA3D|nr:PITH domain-containing protein CG6153 isoform X2 [Ostrinia furnacalis]
MAHSHCHDGHHDHDHADSDEMGIQYNLFEKIDKENLECLNESIDGAGKTVFKPWDKRLDRTNFVESDADEELLFNIPFTGNVKLKGIRISSEDTDAHPAKLRLVVTFSSVSHLSMHFPSNFGAESTKIYYIGLKGEWTPGHRHGVTICTYEARPNLDDHKLKHLDSVAKHID